MDDNPRIRNLNSHAPPAKGRYIVYWMQSTFRAHGNPALDAAILWANELGLPCVVYAQPWLGGPLASERRAAFQLEAMAELGGRFRSRRIAFLPYIPLENDAPPSRLMRLLPESAGLVVDDCSISPFAAPMKRIGAKVPIPIRAVDSTNILPLSRIPEGCDVTAIRAIVKEVLEAGLVKSIEVEPDVPSVKVSFPLKAVDWTKRSMGGVLAVSDLSPFAILSQVHSGGLTHARRRLSTFIDAGLGSYHTGADDPSAESNSSLSPYIAQGQIDPIEVALSVRSATAPPEAIEAFFERFLVQRIAAFAGARGVRGLTPSGLREDARKSLASLPSAVDPSLQFPKIEEADTGDPLFDACQRELLTAGTIHPAARLYWGRHVITSAPTPKDGLSRLFLLQQRYALDGSGPCSLRGIDLACQAAAGQIEVPSLSEDAVATYAKRTARLWSEKEDEVREAWERGRLWAVRKGRVKIRKRP